MTKRQKAHENDDSPVSLLVRRRARQEAGGSGPYELGRNGTVADSAYSITLYLQNAALTELHQGTTRGMHIDAKLKRYVYDVKLVEHVADCMVKHLMSDSDAYNLRWWGNDQNTQRDSRGLKTNHAVIDGYGYFENKLIVHQVKGGESTSTSYKNLNDWIINAKREIRTKHRTNEFHTPHSTWSPASDWSNVTFVYSATRYSFKTVSEMATIRAENELLLFEILMDDYGRPEVTSADVYTAERVSRYAAEERSAATKNYMRQNTFQENVRRSTATKIAAEPVAEPLVSGVALPDPPETNDTGINLQRREQVPCHTKGNGAPAEECVQCKTCQKWWHKTDVEKIHDDVFADVCKLADWVCYHCLGFCTYNACVKRMEGKTPTQIREHLRGKIDIGTGSSGKVYFKLLKTAKNAGYATVKSWVAAIHPQHALP